MHIVFLGAPGSGKGTQAEKLIEKLHLNHLATGDMLRAEIASGSDLGHKAKAVIEAGELVSDDIVIGMIEARLDGQGALFDGFPRTLAQAQALDGLLEKHGLAIDYAVLLEVDNEEIVARMLGRGRADDNEETIRNRLSVFENQTKPLVDYYHSRGKLHRVAGKGSVDEIAAEIARIVGA